MDAVAHLNTALAGRYVVEREIGRGGMATVYLAHDLRHDRHVALKLLDPEFGAVLGIERFLAEIRVTANLQHPNLLPLFDSGEVDGLLFYVMPFVEGESLRTRLSRERQLRVSDAVHIATAVAGALEYAHAHGVIHRDLKPENILINAGEPLVADFGIALAVSNAGGERVTQGGLALGTPQYMSPEQATGDRTIDARSDIYSLGAVLYEMLTGEPPHPGATAQAVIARVVTERPRDVRSVRPAVPEHVAAAVAVALEKLPADRWATAREFADALRGRVFSTRTTTGAARAASHAPRARAWRRAIAGAAGVAAVGLVTAFAVAAWRYRAEAHRPMRYVVLLPDGVTLDGGDLALSPDGGRLLVAGIVNDSSSVFERALDSLEWRRIPGTTGAAGLAFADDGNTVLFVQRDRLKRMAIGGGPAVDVTTDRWVGAEYGPDGTLYFTPLPNAGVWTLAPGATTARELTHPDSAHGELGHYGPQVLPGGDWLLYTAFSMPIPRSRILARSLRTGEVKVLAGGGMQARYVGGVLFFSLGDAIMAVPLDVRTMKVDGTPLPVQQGVGGSLSNGRSAFRVSDNGTLVYVPETVMAPPRELVWVDRSGRVTPALPTPALYLRPRLSPNGRRIAVDIQRGGVSNLWVYEVDHGTFTAITSNEQSTIGSVWSPDGSSLFYVMETPAFDVFRRAANAATQEQLVLASRNDKLISDITRDGSTLLLGHRTDRWRLGVIDLTDPDSVTNLKTGTEAGEFLPMLSPDGRWLLYVSGESGQFEVYVRSYPDLGRVKQQVSVAGGSEPRWTRGGHEIVFRSARFNQSMYAASFDPSSGIAGRPVRLFTGSFAATVGQQDYDVTADGNRFLMVRRPDERGQAYAVVVVHWLDEVRRRVAQR